MITIIITAYNVEKTIGKAIESCLSQTYKDLEILIVNDCSTDNTVEVINSYNDDRIRLVSNDVNVGAGLSRRRGSKEAKGEYTMFLDGDDWLDNDCIEKMYNLAIENNADVVSQGVKIIVDGKVERVDTYEKDFEIRKGKDVVDDPAMIKRFLNNKLIRRSIWDKVDYNSRRFVEDTQTCYFVMHYVDVCVNIKYAGYNYIQNPNSLCHQADYIKLAIYRTLCAKDIWEFCKEYEPENTKEALAAFGIRLREICQIANIPDSIRELYKDELAELMTFFLQNIIF